ncbi:hypothetical protein QYE76_039500 [Lolium multiflorum]|uniref:Protein ALP1-like n=1 Tax=Lolium multiflorum TaxID=4521 RepID=A0AAD8TB65_LOLMU|nr:hypothetical protein QYE76_039500 [Lolium multiflorum]
MQGKAPRVSYEINGNAYDKPYYLADGIYPDWATLVKTVRNPNSEKTRRFAKMQEACRKDVERGFGVLQARWAIVRHPARTWSLKTMHEVMTCCVIMHNMIVENERPDGRNENHWEFQDHNNRVDARSTGSWRPACTTSTCMVDSSLAVLFPRFSPSASWTARSSTW